MNREVVNFAKKLSYISNGKPGCTVIFWIKILQFDLADP